MINCSKTKNYFLEKQRMIKKHKYICEFECADCPLHWSKNGMSISCTKLEKNYPDKAIAIIQKWSDEHPQKTYLSELLKFFPNSSLDENGIPTFCPHHLGFMSVDNCRTDGNCSKCWKQPVEESENK